VTAHRDALIALAREICTRAHAPHSGIHVGQAIAISPCGGCRQRIREFAADGQVLVHFPWRGAELRTATVDELLPFAFELPGMRTP